MPIQKNKTQNKKELQKQLLLVIAFVVLVSLGAQLTIDLGGDIDLSLQTLFIGVIYYFMKFRWRLVAVMLYLGLGIAGIEVFSNGNAGWEYFTGNSIGFFIGFILVSFIRPLKGNYQNILTYMLLIHIVILAAGLLALSIINLDLKVFTELGFALLPGLVIKSLIAASICLLLGRWSALNGLNAR